MKELKDFNIKEFNTYKELLEMDEPDVFGIFELFGLNPVEMPFDKFNKVWGKIQQMTLVSKGVQSKYVIDGRRFKVDLNHLKLSAGLFIDFLTYMRDFKLEEVLSVFLIPQYKKWGRWHTYRYNDGYDVIEVLEYLLNNMKIGTAQDISSFFFKSSLKLLKVMKGFLEKKELKAKKKLLKQQEVSLLG